ARRGQFARRRKVGRLRAMATRNLALAARCPRQAPAISTAPPRPGEKAMTAVSSALEQRLLRAYQEQLRHYDCALAVVDRQSRVGSDLPQAAAWVEELNAALQDVRDLDT